MGGELAPAGTWTSDGEAAPAGSRRPDGEVAPDGARRIDGEGGELAVAALRAHGVDTLFTLSGGHIFSVLHAAAGAGMRIVDVRHEQTAVFAAEGYARLGRRPAVALLTAGPGVTNGISGLATAQANGAPVVVLAGRAAHKRWGSGALQEFDHIPLVAPVTKDARTVTRTEAIPGELRALTAAAATPHRGPVFLDIPLDVMHRRASATLRPPLPADPPAPDPDEIAEAAELLATARRPVLVAGGDVWWGGAWEALRHCAESLRVPTFANGQGRGCLPARHELSFSRSRAALKEADVVVVAGTPLDFRLSFGRFGNARVVHAVDHPALRATHVPTAAAPAGDLRHILDGMAAWSGPRTDHEEWIRRLRERERALRAAERPELEHAGEPIHPARVLGELIAQLDHDAVVIGDGGDFVSYAGRLVDSHLPGRWLDPGPFGCLGNGIGYAIAARLLHPDRQVVLLLGDGAFGFSAGDVDTLVRHRLPVVMVVGNNGGWGLEKHPMRALYGADVAADLRPGSRYDQVVRALGGAGETVTDPRRIAPALRRAFAAGEPYLVNVLTDPEVAYRRSAKLG
ncbi:acetolactate synthase [Streptomyces achromogenes]|uniref:acetolactate synthase n=1 Tax=Streptomyces achromogenes TaxID=67255 RepID=UPI003702C562